ncbi:MAG: flagellar basal-body MS-ring/collar protein FliF [bacterium]
MARAMDNFLSPINDFWKRLTLGQKAGLVVSTALVLCLLAALLTWTSKAPFATLYSDLSEKDASKVAEELRESKIPYRLAEGGSKILVPENQVYELRLHFASLGLPNSGVLGYELFDKPMLGMTEFMQKINFRRALEGELSRTIGELEEVESARVHLVLPEPSLYSEEKKEPTASVVVRLKPNVQMARRQIQGICYLIAYAVEGLTVDNITLVDASGNPLSGTLHRDAVAGLTATQLEVQFALEDALARKAGSLLDGVLGSGKAQVKVAAKLNWDRIERTVERFDPDQIAVRSEERRESSGEGDTEGGATSQENQITNYEIPRTVEKIVPEVGGVGRLSVSVLVDGTYRIQKDASGKETREFVDRTPAEMRKLTDLVKTAVGFDETRKDQISVVCFPFERVEEPLLSVDSPTGNRLLMPILEKGILALLLVGIFLLARSLLRRVSFALPALPTMEAVPAKVTGGHATAALPSARTTEPALPAARATSSEGPKVIFKTKEQTPIEIEEEEIPAETLRRAELQKRASQFVLEKPEQATQLVRSWIVEEKYESQKK